MKPRSGPLVTAVIATCQTIPVAQRPRSNDSIVGRSIDDSAPTLSGALAVILINHIQRKPSHSSEPEEPFKQARITQALETHTCSRPSAAAVANITRRRSYLYSPVIRLEMSLFVKRYLTTTLQRSKLNLSALAWTMHITPTSQAGVFGLYGGVGGSRIKRRDDDFQ